jgi:pyruvate dehydrogenase E1 component alpha subunit
MVTTKWKEARPDENFVRVLAPDGSLVGPDPGLEKATLRKLHATLVLSRAFEEYALRMQRRGELSVTAASTGEEAAGLGTAAALRPGDFVWPSYRQTALHLYWGVPIDRTFAILLGSAPEVVAKHLPLASTPEVGFAPYAVIIASNICNAAGMALADKLRGRDAVTVAFTGDGGTSEGDFHEGLNFAGVQRVPAVFIVQNNHWSISVPVHRQTASASMACKAVAYGIPGERVDGNDVLAMHAVVRAAVARARAGEGPTLIEAVTYRVADHNTSDSASLYRDDDVAAHWRTLDPRVRFEAYLRSLGVLDAAQIDAVEATAAAQVSEAADRARALPRAPAPTMFENHIAPPGWSTRLQMKELEVELAGGNPYTDIDPSSVP